MSGGGGLIGNIDWVPRKIGLTNKYTFAGVEWQWGNLDVLGQKPGHEGLNCSLVMFSKWLVEFPDSMVAIFIP